MWRAVSCPLRQENLCLHSLPRHLPYQRSRSSPGKEKPFPAEPGKPLGSTLFCHFKSYATLTWSMTGISTNDRLFICSYEDRALILHAFKTVWKCLFFVSQCVCFWISPSLQFLISSSQSAEAFIAAVYLCGSMREQCLRTLWFLWGWWVLCLKKLDSSGKFLPFFFFLLPFSIESGKEKKAASGKGVDRETCLWLDLQLIFYIYMRRVSQLLIKLLWSCIVNPVSPPKSTSIL